MFKALYSTTYGVVRREWGLPSDLPSPVSRRYCDGAATDPVKLVKGSRLLLPARIGVGVMKSGWWW